MGKSNIPCYECGGNKWKTLIKGKKYQCRQLVFKEVKIVNLKLNRLVYCGAVRENE